jgi:hypothetical protein
LPNKLSETLWYMSIGTRAADSERITRASGCERYTEAKRSIRGIKNSVEYIVRRALGAPVSDLEMSNDVGCRAELD